MFDNVQKEEERRISCCHHGLATSEWFYYSPIDLTVADMGPWLSNLLILAACCYECRGEDSVIQPQGDVIATEGEQVTLDCQFDAVNTNDLNLFWYKHEVNGFPKFMLGRFRFGSKNATEFKDRFDAHLDADSKSVPLTIQRLQLSDSAVYYCALRPTVSTGYTASIQKLFDSVI
uniref:Ig-like domain-containing protein n=1 Tax=Salmo trutta TaxID=8032 RepID=A0A674F3D3_SALTR